MLEPRSPHRLHPHPRVQRRRQGNRSPTPFIGHGKGQNREVGQVVVVAAYRRVEQKKGVTPGRSHETGRHMPSATAVATESLGNSQGQKEN